MIRRLRFRPGFTLPSASAGSVVIGVLLVLVDANRCFEAAGASQRPQLDNTASLSLRSLVTHNTVIACLSCCKEQSVAHGARPQARAGQYRSEWVRQGRRRRDRHEKQPTALQRIRLAVVCGRANLERRRDALGGDLGLDEALDDHRVSVIYQWICTLGFMNIKSEDQPMSNCLPQQHCGVQC